MPIHALNAVLIYSSLKARFSEGHGMNNENTNKALHDDLRSRLEQDSMSAEIKNSTKTINAGVSLFALASAYLVYCRSTYYLVNSFNDTLASIAAIAGIALMAYGAYSYREIKAR